VQVARKWAGMAVTEAWDTLKPDLYSMKFVLIQQRSNGGFTE
jgi:hypothetical protein